jgi:hypothetical protein
LAIKQQYKVKKRLTSSIHVLQNLMRRKMEMDAWKTLTSFKVTKGEVFTRRKKVAATKMG